MSHGDDTDPKPQARAAQPPRTALPDSKLADAYAAKLAAAITSAEAEQVIDGINGDIAAKLLTRADTERLAPVVINVRSKFAPPKVETRSAEGEQRADFQRRFEEKYEKTDGCWNWTASVHHSGYGQFNVDGRPELAHRVSYGIYCGAIPGGQQVLHRCDNRRCVRPDHLFLGTHTDNMRDMAAKDRGDPRPGEESNFAKLTEAAVADIRARYKRENHSKSNARELAHEYGVTKRCIVQVVAGETWARSVSNVEDESQFPITSPAPPTPEPADGVQKAGGNIVQVILSLAHQLGVSWPEIRDGVDKGGEIATEAALPKMPVDFKVTSLSADEALRLHTVLTERVERKKANAAKRAENAKRREAEEVGVA
jgi:hypothetical protein